jgi:hypothetical protein
MRPEDLRDFNRRQPFTPYRIHVTDGQTYDIRHPDQALVLRSRVIVGVDAESGIADRVEHVALVHIVRIEELQSESVA